MGAYVNVCVCVYGCVGVYVPVCVCLYIYLHGYSGTCMNHVDLKTHHVVDLKTHKIVCVCVRERELNGVRESCSRMMLTGQRTICPTCDG